VTNPDQPDRVEHRIRRRVVSSAYGSGADWEHEFFAEMVAGWGAMLDNLASHFNQVSEPASSG
jgi:hypothetical protein